MESLEALKIPLLTTPRDPNCRYMSIDGKYVLLFFAGRKLIIFTVYCARGQGRKFKLTLKQHFSF